MDVAPGTVVVWSDVACPWSTLAVHRLHAARRRLGFDGRVSFVHRAFPLELANERPTPWTTLHAEIPVVGGLEPSLGFRMWQRPPWEWPVTSLPALEAVKAAAAQSPAAAEELDLALRRALFAESRCISMRHVLVDVAAGCPSVDADRLAADLDAGRYGVEVVEDHRAAEASGVQGSPHVFLTGGVDAFNPGIEMHQEGGHGAGFPVVDADDPGVYERLLKAAVD